MSNEARKISHIDAGFVVRQNISSTAGMDAINEQTPLGALGLGSGAAIAAFKTSIEETLNSASSFRLVTPIAITQHMTIGQVVGIVQLSARKLCSNPKTPHEQPCCPYPTVCVCGWDVK
jgi:hypothetical protein